MKVKIVSGDGELVEGILITPENERIVNAFKRDVLNSATREYFTVNETAAVLAYVLRLLEEPEET